MWSANHQICFEQIKDAVCKDVTLKFYDPNLPLYIETDASQKGIGVVLLQPIDNPLTLMHRHLPKQTDIDSNGADQQKISNQATTPLQY